MSEVKNIPDGWIETTLGENLTEIAMGPFGSNLKVDMFTESGVPVIKGGNLLESFVGGDFSFVSEEKATSLRKAIAYPDDLIITHRGTLGQVSLVPKNKFERYITSQSQLRLSVNPKKLNYRYLLYFFKSRLGQYELLKNASQVGVPAIATPTKSVKEIDLTIPSNIKEQEAIADILSALDDKIELFQAQNKTLEETAQTIFEEWFGKYKIDEDLPEGWKTVMIKDFDVIVTDYVANGSFASLAENVTYKIEPDYAKLIRLTDYNNGFNGDFIYVDKNAYDFLNKSKLLGGEIIISNVGAYAGTVFKCPQLNSPMTLGPNSIVLKSNYSNYFFLLFSSRVGKHFLNSIITGSAQPKFNKTAFRNLELSFPNENYLVRFERTVAPLMEKIEQNKNQIQGLSQTRDELLPRLMSGEIRLNEFKA